MPSAVPSARLRGPDIVGIRMVRAAGLRPRRAEIDQLAFQALDLMPQRGTARTHERHHAAGRAGPIELDREQVEDRLLVLAIDIAALDGVDTVEPQGGAATLELRDFTERALPVEPRQADHQPAFGG